MFPERPLVADHHMVRIATKQIFLMMPKVAEFYLKWLIIIAPDFPTAWFSWIRQIGKATSCSLNSSMRDT